MSLLEQIRQRRRSPYANTGRKVYVNVKKRDRRAVGAEPSMSATRPAAEVIDQIKPVKNNMGIESVYIPGSHWWHIVWTLGE